MAKPNTFDYIIVGAGSAGCVLANRLTENPNTQVLLLEYGGSDQSVFIQMPAALSIPMNTQRYNWGFVTTPEAELNNRIMDCPRGKVLGGSSSINGMVYVRGHAKDFDEWEQTGATGWDYQSCLPYFKKAETWIKGEDTYRGQNGPLQVSLGNQDSNPLYRAFIDAGVQAGYPETTDYNGKSQEGFSSMQMTVANGRRNSTANAYLKPILERTNLTVISHALSEKILLENKTAIGVEYIYRGKRHQAFAHNEVLLAAGAIGSPHLLQCSGIGPKDVLQKAGIFLHHELPGVGRNLHDHLEFYFQFKCKKPITLNSKLNLLSKAKIGAEWLLTKGGLGATNHFESCGFIKSSAEAAWPDIQYHFLPAAVRYDGKGAVKGHGYQVHVGHNKPKSRGSLKALSANILDKPKIQFNYLQHPDDKAGFRSALRLTREIMQQSAFNEFSAGEIQPGIGINNDQQIDAYLAGALESAYHPCGSCKMGNDDLAVVDPQTKVHGIAGLRVIDTSIFPTATNGNLNAPVIMVAEKAADMVKGA